MKRLSLILIILVYITSYSFDINENYSSFYDLVKEIQSFSSFTEDGVKMEYKSEQNKVEEIAKLKMIFIKKFKIRDCTSIDNEININVNNMFIITNVFEDNGGSLVEIKIINYDNEKSLSNLMKELTELQTNNAKEIKYFQYFKGKIDNKERIIDEVSKIPKLKKVKTLDIHNGYVGTACLNDGQRVNFVTSSYNSGTYIIIGTPIIFSTY